MRQFHFIRLASSFPKSHLAKTAYHRYLLLQPPRTFLRIGHISYDTGAAILVQVDVNRGAANPRSFAFSLRSTRSPAQEREQNVPVRVSIS